MINENDNRLDGYVNENREGGYSRNSNREYNNYNRYNNDGEQRSYRPRTNNYNQGGERVYRSSYGDRPQRPRFNSAEGGERPFRPRTNNYGQGGYGDRPQRPRFNSAEGGERPFRPRTNNYGQGGYGDRPQRPQRSFRPRTNDYNPNAKYSNKKQIEYRDILTDPNEPIRLNKFLANAGVCSRREADEFIAAGVVSVNGEVVTELGTKIKRTDEVKFHDQPINIERKVYVLLNKPKDCVTTYAHSDQTKINLHFRLYSN